MQLRSAHGISSLVKQTPQSGPRPSVREGCDAVGLTCIWTDDLVWGHLAISKLFHLHFRSPRCRYIHGLENLSEINWGKHTPHDSLVNQIPQSDPWRSVRELALSPQLWWCWTLDFRQMILSENILSSLNYDISLDGSHTLDVPDAGIFKGLKICLKSIEENTHCMTPLLTKYLSLTLDGQRGRWL